jgi:hypothetical protein
MPSRSSPKRKETGREVDIAIQPEQFGLNKLIVGRKWKACADIGSSAANIHNSATGIQTKDEI